MSGEHQFLSNGAGAGVCIYCGESYPTLGIGGTVSPVCIGRPLTVKNPAIATLEAKLAAAVEQAKTQAQEARTQKAIVLDILRLLDLPLRDYEAVSAVQGYKDAALARAEALRGALADVVDAADRFAPERKRTYSHEQACLLLKLRAARHTLAPRAGGAT